MNFKADQQRLYGLLNEQTRCFVRVCDGRNALWVSDFPRRCAETAAAEEKLKQAGFSVQKDGGLWYIDWTEESWQQTLDSMPDGEPLFPQAQKLHAVYALCRLLLAHPSQRQEEHMPALRAAVKLAAGQTVSIAKTVRELHEEAAVQLRRGRTVAYHAGRILAAWLQTLENGKEKLQ